MMYRMLPYSRSNGLNNWFDEIERSFFPAESRRMPTFRTDVRDEGSAYRLEAELPGFRKEDIELEVKDGVLTISASREEGGEEKKGNYLYKERRSGSFTRSFEVSGIREEDIAAAYENGVLILTLPKRGEPEPQSRKIAIQ